MNWMVIVATGDDNIPAARPDRGCRQRSERRPPIGWIQALDGYKR